MYVVCMRVCASTYIGVCMQFSLAKSVRCVNTVSGLACPGAQGKRGRHQLHASTVETHSR